MHATYVPLCTRTCEGTHRGAQVGLWVLAELALSTVSLVTGNHMVPCSAYV